MAQTKTRILLIDDQIDCLDQLKASLSSKQDEWTLEFSNNPQQALESILSDPPTIVICDYNMPQINGAQLLREAEKAHPFLHRFIIADREDLGILEDGIGSAFHFLPKPCPADRLISEIQRCLSVEKWLGKSQIKNIVGTLGELPSLPSVYLKIVEALNDSSVSIERVGKSISTDITISARILKIVNSSYFGFEETISDISQAVSVLGIETVKNLVLAIQVFSEGQDGKEGSQTDRLWQHSMNVATAAKNLMMYETGSSKLAEGAYTSGLFHDIGKLIMQRAAPSAYESAQELARRKDIPSWEAEDEMLGCNHAEAGAYLLARWGLPIEVIESAALHHEPVNSSGSSFSPLVAVYIGNRLLNEKESNPNAEYECKFVSGLGKAAEWPAWRKIVAGNAVDENLGLEDSPSADNANSEPISKWNSESSDQVSTSGPSDKGKKRNPKSLRNGIIAGTCIAACAAFACVLVVKSTSTDSIGEWEQGSFAAESDLQNFDTISAEELVVESFGQSAEAVKFPKINITKIYYDLPIPAADVNSKLVRIGDNISGVSIVGIEQKNVIVQYEGIRKSYSLNH